MERRKPSKGKNDELAMVKAAAWSWYQHGSGSEGQAVREYDLAVSKKSPKPSRYKLEAMKESSSQETRPLLVLKRSPDPLSPLSSTATNSDINSLLDDYEIERISKQLDLYIESSRARAEYFRSILGSTHHHHCGSNKVVSFSESGSTTSEKKRSNKSIKNKINSRGFWLKYAAAVCGSRDDDVVEGRSFNVAYLRGGGRKRM